MNYVVTDMGSVTLVNAVRCKSGASQVQVCGPFCKITIWSFFCQLGNQDLVHHMRQFLKIFFLNPVILAAVTSISSNNFSSLSEQLTQTVSAYSKTGLTIELFFLWIL